MRLILSTDLPCGLHDVKRFSLGEMIQHHAALDAFDDLRELERQRRERERKHKQAGGR